MQTIRLTVGSVQSGSSGTVRLDTRRPVEFEGENLAEYHEPGIGRDGIPTDTRGTVETLYRTADGRLVVHVHDWSRWQGEPDVETLHAITEADLSGNGRFEALGHVAGYGRPLTLEEALTPLDRLEYDEEGVRHCENCDKPLPKGERAHRKLYSNDYLCDDCAGCDH